MSDYLKKSKKYKGYHYSVLKPEMIQYLHEKTLEMIKIIIPIFEKNNIRYMICGGTLLGAVTTGHFIPWDDDLDICVLEDDYEKMRRCLINDVPDWMIVQCRETEPHYYHGWIKVRDKRSKVYPCEKEYGCNGVWIDIYKLTKIKQKNVSYLITKEHLDYLIRRYKGKCINFKELISRIHSNNLIFNIIREKIKLLFSKDNADTYIIWSASKILIEPKWCFPSSTVEFEGMKLKSFHKATTYLRRHYGDNYSKLPPDEMRRVGINNIEVAKND